MPHPPRTPRTGQPWRGGSRPPPPQREFGLGVSGCLGHGGAFASPGSEVAPETRTVPGCKHAAILGGGLGGTHRNILVQKEEGQAPDSGPESREGWGMLSKGPEAGLWKGRGSPWSGFELARPSIAETPGWKFTKGGGRAGPAVSPGSGPPSPPRLPACTEEPPLLRFSRAISGEPCRSETLAQDPFPSCPPQLCL